MPAPNGHNGQAIVNGWNGFAKAMTDLPFSDAALARQDRNLQVIYRANLVAIEGAQAFVNRQFEIARETMGEFSSMFRSFFAAGSVDDRVAKQAQHSKQVLERSFASIRELGEILGTVQTETLSVINQHVMNGLDDVRDCLRVGAAEKAAAE